MGFDRSEIRLGGADLLPRISNIMELKHVGLFLNKTISRFLTYHFMKRKCIIFSLIAYLKLIIIIQNIKYKISRT
jgi:hypothetical protein